MTPGGGKVNVAAAPAAPVHVPDEAMAAADVSANTMAAAALPAGIDMEPCRGTKRLGDDDLDDSTAGIRKAARLLDAGTFDVVCSA